MSQFARWECKAKAKGWKTPTQGETFPAWSWINYWKACEALETNPAAGRPVVPHRSASHHAN
jgi:hypothetical protein